MMWWIIHHTYKLQASKNCMDERTVLREIGLSANEAEVYLALLKNGVMGAGKLSVRTGVHRRTVYDALEALQKKGLAGAVEINGRQMFQASEPKQLESFLDEKKEALSQVMPSLQKFAKIEVETQITVLRGKAGLKAILKDVLEVRQTLYVFGGQMKMAELGSSYEFFTRKRQELGIGQKMILLDKEEVRKRAAALPLIEARFIDPSDPSTVAYWMYGNRLAIVVWKEEPEVVRIVSGEYVKAFRKSFDLAWNEEAKTYYGLEGIKALLDDTLNYPETVFIGGSGQAPLRLQQYFREKYVPEALKNGHIWRNIAYKKILTTPATKLPFHKIRFFAGSAPSPTVVWIWGDNVANVVWLKNPVAFLVKNKEAAKSYREYFETLWKGAKPAK